MSDLLHFCNKFLRYTVFKVPINKILRILFLKVFFENFVLKWFSLRFLRKLCFEMIFIALSSKTSHRNVFHYDFSKTLLWNDLCNKFLKTSWLMLNQSSKTRRISCFKSLIQRFFFFYNRRPPTLPYRLQYSTIGRLGLHHRVRDGNGCFP